jgi:hypothetical protein
MFIVKILVKKNHIQFSDYYLTLNFMVTFFVIATKKITERHPERMRRISIWRTLRKIRCFADAQHDGQTRSLCAFCLASATKFVFKWNSLRSLSLCEICVK